jgi:hypothetical protein
MSGDGARERTSYVRQDGGRRAWSGRGVSKIHGPATQRPHPPVSTSVAQDRGQSRLGRAGRPRGRLRVDCARRLLTELKHRRVSMSDVLSLQFILEYIRMTRVVD